MRASSGAAHGGGSSDGPLGSNEAVGEGGFFFDADLKDMRSPAFLIIPVCLSSEVSPLEEITLNQHELRLART